MTGCASLVAPAGVGGDEWVPFVYQPPRERRRRGADEEVAAEEKEEKEEEGKDRRKRRKIMGRKAERRRSKSRSKMRRTRNSHILCGNKDCKRLRRRRYYVDFRGILLLYTDLCCRLVLGGPVTGRTPTIPDDCSGPVPVGMGRS